MAMMKLNKDFIKKYNEILEICKKQFPAHEYRMKVTLSTDGSYTIQGEHFESGEENGTVYTYEFCRRTQLRKVRENG